MGLDMDIMKKAEDGKMQEVAYFRNAAFLHDLLLNYIGTPVKDIWGARMSLESCENHFVPYNTVQKVLSDCIRRKEEFREYDNTCQNIDSIINVLSTINPTDKIYYSYIF